MTRSISENKEDELTGRRDFINGFFNVLFSSLQTSDFVNVIELKKKNPFCSILYFLFFCRYHNAVSLSAFRSECGKNVVCYFQEEIRERTKKNNGYCKSLEGTCFPNICEYLYCWIATAKLSLGRNYPREDRDSIVYKITLNPQNRNKKVIIGDINIVTGKLVSKEDRPQIHIEFLTPWELRKIVESTTNSIIPSISSGWNIILYFSSSDEDVGRLFSRFGSGKRIDVYSFYKYIKRTCGRE